MAGKKSGDLSVPSPHPDWFRPSADGNALCIFLYVQPNARSTELAGFHDGRLKVRIAAPALDGRANELLLDFLRKQLDLPASRIALIKGARSRMKTIEIAHPSPEVIATLLRWARG